MSEEAITARVVPPPAATVPVKAWKYVLAGHAVRDVGRPGSPTGVRCIGGCITFPDGNSYVPRPDDECEDHGPAVATIRDGKMTIERVGAKSDPRETMFQELKPLDLFRFVTDLGGSDVVRMRTNRGWVWLRGCDAGHQHEVGPSSFAEPTSRVIRLGRLEIGGAE